MSRLQKLYNKMVADDQSIGKWDSLPTYGGPVPADTRQVWSWDQTHMIVGSCPSDIKIVKRS